MFSSSPSDGRFIQFYTVMAAIALRPSRVCCRKRDVKLQEACSKLREKDEELKEKRELTAEKRRHLDRQWKRLEEKERLFQERFLEFDEVSCAKSRFARDHRFR